MRRKKKISNQTTNKNITIVNAADEVFDIHRRFVLTIAIKIDDRKKNENFTAAVANETSETNEEKVNKTTAIDEAAKKKRLLLTTKQ